MKDPTSPGVVEGTNQIHPPGLTRISYIQRLTHDSSSTKLPAMNTRTNPVNPTAQLKPVFDEAFKHQIGDVVCLNEHVVSDQAEMHVNAGRKADRYGESIKYNPPLGMTITGRMMEECYGGIQAHYRLTGFLGADGKQIVLTMQEFQVVSYEEALNQRRKLRDEATKKEE